MTPRQINLVRNTFDMVVPIADLMAALFYGRLFELEPTTRPMFHGDLPLQGNKLMMTLAMVVQGLDNMEPILPTVHQLGHQHTSYGVRPDHYDLVGEALMWTLDHGLGEAFTPETEEAWMAAYNVMAEAMQETSRTQLTE